MVIEYMAESLNEDIVVATTTEASPRLGWWAILSAVVGPVGARLAIVFPIPFLAAGLGFLEVDAAWLAPLLEVAVTPVALVVTLTFGTATVLLTSEAPLSGTWSNKNLKAMVGMGFLVGVVALVAILVYLAFVGVWWAEGFLSLLGVVAIGFTGPRRSVCGTHGADSYRVRFCAGPPRLAQACAIWSPMSDLYGAVQHAGTGFLGQADSGGSLCTAGCAGKPPWASAFRYRHLQVWRDEQPGKASGIASLAWGLMPWLLAVFYFT